VLLLGRQDNFCSRLRGRLKLVPNWTWSHNLSFCFHVSCCYFGLVYSYIKCIVMLHSDCLVCVTFFWLGLNMYIGKSWCFWLCAVIFQLTLVEIDVVLWQNDQVSYFKSRYLLLTLALLLWALLHIRFVFQIWSARKLLHTELGLLKNLVASPDSIFECLVVLCNSNRVFFDKSFFIKWRYFIGHKFLVVLLV